MPAELRRLRRRLDWLEAFASVRDSQLRTQGLRIEVHLEQCEPAAHNERESKLTVIAKTQAEAALALAAVDTRLDSVDTRFNQVTRLLHELAARQDAQAAELASLAKLLGRPTEDHEETRREETP